MLPVIDMEGVALRAGTGRVRAAEDDLPGFKRWTS